MNHENTLFSPSQWKGVAVESRKARSSKGKRFVASCVAQVTRSFTCWAKHPVANGLTTLKRVATQITDERRVQQDLPLGV